jgi:nicotinamide-nucleotide amidase
MKVEILAIGTEVVQGDVVNTNASWLSNQMSDQGFEVLFHTAVPDEENLMLDAMARAASRADVVLVTGGLGPTVDDFTLEVASKLFQVPLVPHAESLKRLKTFFQKFNRTMTPNQERQAMLPEGAAVLTNEIGTAPGIYYRYLSAHFGFFPGVPQEMKKMFTEGFLPRVLPFVADGPKRLRRVLRCFGLPEGQLDHWVQGGRSGHAELMGVELGFRVRFPEIDIRIQTTDARLEEAARRLDEAGDAILRQVGEYIFGQDEATLAQVASDLLLEKDLSLAVAESCTGGLLASAITDIPGASEYFLEGLVTYSNDAKIDLLGVRPESLERFGAVSREVALEMARGVRARAKSDLGIGITGIAGPGGGTPEKPVGTVHVAMVHSEGEWEQRYLFPWGRDRFKQVAVATALDRIRRHLLSIA